jgi:hypothetical protein
MLRSGLSTSSSSVVHDVKLEQTITATAFVKYEHGSDVHALVDFLS